ncbi:MULTISPECIES: hypothetical protein [Streptomyces]|uniref:Uncharacterized protein n=2 Tax=Streptomyces rimosus subsp. rimosus TaxID=132474 RepID=L8EVP9_STRR1|nr:MULTISPECIES: hypothetical protein [Streptomyces]KOG75508.1 hypothetical protein ADK78_11605 [Kitasatospora aureofaciens]MYT47626.1 hypothetical protein [Streptomyces sp. SID5471]KUJ39228.1 hypothetical protein ADK46_12775 [Streptomyces rimosus subsp. rimosus]QDA08966.1 hypothetical protein CTZ40_39725 [Streptomyces rimosus]QEV80244.1 hypothetical protein CP984_39680 [Streptomyces rimosus]
MTEAIRGWILTYRARPFLELLSRYAGYDFDDTDWAAVEAGVKATDAADADGWYSYPLVGRGDTLEVRLANAVGGDELSVVIVGAGTYEMCLRADTLLSAFATD